MSKDNLITRLESMQDGETLDEGRRDPIMGRLSRAKMSLGEAEKALANYRKRMGSNGDPKRFAPLLDEVKLQAKKVSQHMDKLMKEIEAL